MQRRRTRRQLAVATVATLALFTLPAAAAAPASPGWVGGADRYATSAVIARQAFPAGVDTVFLARGDDFPDALAGGAAAASASGVGGAPVLLTRSDTLPHVVRDEIKRLNPSTVVLLGGRTSISTAVEVEVAKLATLVRLSGPNRYATAVQIAEWAFGMGVHLERPLTVHIASGVAFPDALGGGVAAALANGPIMPSGGPLLLTDPGRLSPETEAYLKRVRPDRIVLLGGTQAIPQRVADQAAALAPVTRLSGPDRYATATAISAATFTSAATVFLANGRTFPDALAGTPLAVQQSGPILLVEAGGTLHPSVCAELQRLHPTRIVALGGEKSVSLATRTAAQRCADIHPGPPSVRPFPEPTIGPSPPSR